MKFSRHNYSVFTNNIDILIHYTNYQNTKTRQMFDDFTEEYIKTANVRMLIRRSGEESAPPLVLLHGYPQTSAMWHKVAPLLSGHFQIIIPDL